MRRKRITELVDVVMFPLISDFREHWEAVCKKMEVW